MKDIFNNGDNNSLIERISKLTPDAKAQWGKMNVAQMLAHLQMPLRVATGEVRVPFGIIGLLFGKMAKRQFLKNEGFKPSLPTAKEFLVVDVRDFLSEKAQIVALIQDFGRKGASAIANRKHPFFGEMPDEEWGALLYYHTDHHLKQFGV